MSARDLSVLARGPAGFIVSLPPALRRLAEPEPEHRPQGLQNQRSLALRAVAGTGIAGPRYCRAGCESSRPFGFQGTPPRDLGGVFAFWPTFRRDRESHPSWARFLPLGMSITGPALSWPHRREFRPKSLRVSRPRVPGLTGLRARVGVRDAGFHACDARAAVFGSAPRVHVAGMSRLLTPRDGGAPPLIHPFIDRSRRSAIPRLRQAA